jgi:hypothetical protein
MLYSAKKVFYTFLMKMTELLIIGEGLDPVVFARNPVKALLFKRTFYFPVFDKIGEAPIQFASPKSHCSNSLNKKYAPTNPHL